MRGTPFLRWFKKKASAIADAFLFPQPMAECRTPAFGAEVSEDEIVAVVDQRISLLATVVTCFP